MFLNKNSQKVDIFLYLCVAIKGTSPCGSGFDISSNRSSTHAVFKKEKILQSHRVNGSGLKASKEGCVEFYLAHVYSTSV